MNRDKFTYRGTKPAKPAPHKAYLWLRRIFYGFLVVWAFILLGSSWWKSPVYDEVAHIGAGLTYWTYGDFRMNPEHPPLVKLLSTLPVLVLDNVPLQFQTEKFYVRSWFGSDQFRWGYYALFRTPINPLMVMLHARLVPVVIGVIGVWLAFAWGRAMAGTVLGGVLAGALLMLYPEYAGHARFVTFDVPTLVGCAAISLAAWRWWRRPTGRRALVFAVVAALGAMVKLPVLIFCVVQLGVMATLRGAGFTAVKWRQFGGLVLATVVVLYGAIWAFAGFRFSLTPAGMTIEARSVYAPIDGDYGTGVLAPLLGFVWRWKLLPENFLAVFSHVHSFEGRQYFYRGEYSREGWYSYFFATFVLKTSFVLMALYLAAAVTWVWHLAGASRRVRLYQVQRLAILTLPFLVLFAMMVLSRACLGHRYILFVYFPLSVLTGGAMARWWWRNRVGRMASVGALVYLAGAFAWQYPHYTTYFNEWVRTPYRGMKYLGDSNVDWGQDFGLVGKELRRGGHRQVNLTVFGAGRPSAYGIPNFRWLMPSYPFALFLEDTSAEEIDIRLPTVFSLTGLRDARVLYPGLFDRDPDWIGNSMVIYYPPY